MTESANNSTSQEDAQRIVPNLWFAGNAEEGGNFYAEVFRGARVGDIQRYPTEGLLDFQKELAGQPLTVDVELPDLKISLINAGNEFHPNPAGNFMINFDPSRFDDAAEYLAQMHAALSDGGTELMPLGEYPFSPKYAWVTDKFGVSWQLMLTDPAGEPRPFVIPSLMFCGPAQNRCAEAVEHYLATIPGSRWGNRFDYPEATGPAKPGSVMFSDFQLAGQWFTAMDSGVEQPFTFNEGFSLMISADGQAELDRLWSALSKVPESEQCGWCKDEYGLSWQVIPANMGELMSRPGAYEKMMSMHKIEIDKF